MRVLAAFFLIFASAAFAADEGDWYANAQFGWDVDRKIRNSGIVVGYHPLDEIGLGFVFDQSELFSAPGFDLRWMIEPFEVYTQFHYSFWSQRLGGDWLMMLSLGLNYLISLNSKLALFPVAKVYFPDKQRRSLFLGVGLRYLF